MSEQLYKFLRKETDKWENVAFEKWRWEAHFVDGKVLKQFGDDMIFHQFREIDQSKLKVFRMTNGEKFFDLEFEPEEMKLVHYYDKFNLWHPEGRKLVKVYWFGYEVNAGGKTRKFLTGILPDDSVVITSSPDHVQLT